MRLLYLATGVILLAAAVKFARREVRGLETQLPDHAGAIG